jgi:serine/threonine protein kinase/Tol biopolymer transport system component
MNDDHALCPPRIPDHDLLCLIGRGAYGEVWLARNVMGTFRAIKIIYRRTFEHHRPYEREFEGIKRYEPVSRRHASQVPVLHVGRHEQDQYYYYVMELADDASGLDPISPSTYYPRTLGLELRNRGKLPVEECARLGIALATALENLHEHGLIHRDIKPANVIFVKGVPKLADIGLVAQKDSTVSFVGTRGYFPPEGPGTVQADLYSLGKVLYEMSTGKDRNEFPDLPTELEELSGEEQLLEFNEILLKACHGDSRKRYGSARQLIDDLALLQSGRSVKQKRRRERHAATALRAAYALGLFGILAAFGFTLARKPRVPPSFTAERLVVPSPEFSPRSSFDFAPDGQRILFLEQNGFAIWEASVSVIRDFPLPGFKTVKDGPQTNIWRIPSGKWAVPRWAPDSRQFIFHGIKVLGVRDGQPIRVGAFFLVNTGSGAVHQIGQEVPATEQPVDACWLPNGSGITYVDAQRRFYTLTLSGTRTPWLNVTIPSERDMTLGGYSPDSRWLAVSVATDFENYDERDIWLARHEGGAAFPLVQRPGLDSDPVWGSRSLYFVSSGGQARASTAGLWEVRIDSRTGAPEAESRLVFERRGQRVRQPKLVANGDLIYAMDEPHTRVWVAKTNRTEDAVEITRGQHAVLSPDGTTVYYVDEPDQSGVYGVDLAGRSGPRRVSDLVPSAGHGPTGSGMSISPDGQALAMLGTKGGKLGIWVVPVSGGEPRLVQPMERWQATQPIWSPDAKSIAFVMDQTLYRLARDGHRREELATLHRWIGWEIGWSPDGKHIAALAYAKPEEWEDRVGVFVISLEDRTIKKVSSEAEDQYKEGLGWHPDSRRLNYQYNGPGFKGSTIMTAFIDGRPSVPMIRQTNHWDYIGTWSPTGREFHFISSGGPGEPCGERSVHVYDDLTGEVRHAVGNHLPRWSADGKVRLWTRRGESLRHFELIRRFEPAE